MSRPFKTGDRVRVRADADPTTVYAGCRPGDLGTVTGDNSDGHGVGFAADTDPDKDVPWSLYPSMLEHVDGDPDDDPLERIEAKLDRVLLLLEAQGKCR